MPKPRQVNRLRLARQIDLEGAMVQPCSRCKQSGEECRILLGSMKCGSCTRKGYAGCDVRDVTDADFDKLDNESEKLEEQLRIAKDQKSSARAKIKRLKSQRAYLKSRREELIRRGLNNIEELERLEASERSSVPGLPSPSLNESTIMDDNPFQLSESDITAMLHFGAVGTSSTASPN